MAAWIWVLIPIVAILVGGFSEWLKFKEKQSKLGTSAHELEKTVAVLQGALAQVEQRAQTLVERVQNLETIVTSQTWDALHDPSLPPPQKERALAQSQRRLELPKEPSDEQKAARLAQQLKV